MGTGLGTEEPDIDELGGLLSPEGRGGRLHIRQKSGRGLYSAPFFAGEAKVPEKMCDLVRPGPPTSE